MGTGRLATRRRALLAIALAALAGLYVALRQGGASPPQPAAAVGAAPNPSPPGLWNLARDREREEGQRVVPEETAERLRALGYLQGYEPAPPQQGVTVHDRERAYAGLNLYCSGHAPEAYLIDMEGNALHAWTLSVQAVWPDVDTSPQSARYWRRVHAFENGDLLAIFDGIGLIKLDRRSRLVWAFRADCHHDLFVAPDDTIYVLTRELRVLPEVSADRPSLEEFVTQLGPDGRPRRSVSLYAAFRRSDYAPLLARVSKGGDIFHTNTLTVLDGSLADRWPVLRRGRALISLRNLDTVAVVDLELERVVWALTGLWSAQHEPSALPSGRLLVFDNLGRSGRSRVIELDPLTHEIAWWYPREASQVDIASGTSGTAAQLPNGNVLITESNAGRALEVTRSGRLAWEFWSPHRAGEADELIATLLEVVRLEPEFGGSAGWIGRGGSRGARAGRLRTD